MMANPSEYQTMMYEFFFNGILPRSSRDEDGNVVTKAPTPKKAMDEFEAMLAMQQDPERQAQRKAALQAKLEADTAEREAAGQA
ncbi:MAG: hypothetical protein K0R44_42 [Thermomicrobiales bacterium]|jgi:hypothetical protein|nr:hypothetical protein [Thermomicrobiales bacterium]MDF3014817.1 hypothetical protein [Thermomicrobiales bacterium]